jgi:photosystem II stability/assembly factor-like uncharacterized protein
VLPAGVGSVKMRRLQIAALAVLLWIVVGGVLTAPASAGGTQWTESTTYPETMEPSQLVCSSPTTCIALSYDDYANDPVVLTTTDGGQSWTQSYVADGVKGLDGVACPSTLECVAVGFTNQALNDEGVVLLTTNHGTTWTDETLPSGTPSLGGISCSSADDCITVGYPNPVTSTNLILSTTDGGATWTNETGPASLYDFSDVDCLPNADPLTTECLAYGGEDGNGAILETSDDGAIWTAQTLPTGVGYVSDISCPTPLNCLGMSSSGNYQNATITTSDGGAVWTSKDLSGFDVLGGVSCPTVTDCVATGSYPNDVPAIIATSNGGLTWTADTLSGPDTTMNSVACPSIFVCFATGTDLELGPGIESDVLVGTNFLPLNISTETLPSGVIGQAYSTTLMANGGNPPYLWRLAAGKLPKGLTLDKTTGAITGTPKKTSNSQTFTIEVRDTKSGKPKTQNVTTATFSIGIS